MLSIDFRDSRPIYEQIVDKIEKMAIKGILEPNSQLPSVRQLSMNLSINPNTIQKAYTMLEMKGITYSIKGKGSFIAEDCENAYNLRVIEIEKEFKKLLVEARDIGIKEEILQQWFFNK